jgi:peptide/nickel transport system substrate-binding protein
VKELSTQICGWCYERLKKLGRFFAFTSFRLKHERKLEESIRHFTLSEKTAFIAMVTVFIASSLVLVDMVNNAFMVEVPAQGGTLSEGIVGSPHFVNPLYASSQADQDIAELVYSGLMRFDTETGTLIPDLASDYSVSPDGKTYTFTLRSDARFHDGTAVTADDVVYTVQEAVDPELKSPLAANWAGVIAKKIDDTHVSFTLPTAYAPFLEDTTIGILPKHIWQNVTADEFPFSEYNIMPVGSGPYKVTSLVRDSGGIPTGYVLEANDDYALGAPLIRTIAIHFYATEDALLSAYHAGDIQSINSVSPQKISAIDTSRSNIESAPLPRVFGVFFNQNQAPIFIDKTVRTVLNETVDRNDLIKKVLNGYGAPIYGPLPYGALNTLVAQSTTTIAAPIETTWNTASSTAQLIADAKAKLAKAGYKPGPDGILQKTSGKNGKNVTRLEFTLSTANTAELMATANILKDLWGQIGIKVNVQFFNMSDLDTFVLRPRKYDALLFGEAIGRDLDLYAFWHSSQRTDPGLNIALYTNSKVDTLLSQARTAIDPTSRAKALTKIDTMISADVPAIFLYSPDFIYALPKQVEHFSMVGVSDPSERFGMIEHWYTETQRIWSFFIKN